MSVDEYYKFLDEARGVCNLSTDNLFNINIYPNPSNGIINIEFIDYDIQNVLIELINLQGQVVFVQTITNQKNTINVSDLDKGLYIIKIYTDTGIKAKKLIIN